MTMMTQVRAEVSERLEGLVSSVADLRAQFEGTLARVSPHSTTVMAMLTSYFLHTRSLVRLQRTYIKTLRCVSDRDDICVAFKAI